MTTTYQPGLAASVTAVRDSPYAMGETTPHGVWRKWPDDELAFARAARKKDPPMPFKDIAKALNRSAEAVRVKLIYEDYAERSGHRRGAGRRAA